LEEKDKIFYYVALGMLALGTVASAFAKYNKGDLKGRLPWMTSIIVSLFSGILGGLISSSLTENDKIQWISVSLFAWLGEHGIDAIKETYINKIKK